MGSTGKEQITFPPGVLGDAPVRLPLLARTADFFAVNKPAGVGVSADAMHPDAPLLLDAIAGAINSGKRQMEELGIDYAGRVHGLDAEVTGVVVFAGHKAAEAGLRNAHGSRQIEFSFEILAEAGNDGSSLSCDLPLSRNTGLRRMFVSHGSGKKCATTFEPIEKFGTHTLWIARTVENRPHQIRIHAAACGLRLPGERLYSRVGLIYLSSIKRNFRTGGREPRPLYGSIAMHLRTVTMNCPGGPAMTISAPRPRSFDAALRQIERHTGRRGAP